MALPKKDTFRMVVDHRAANKQVEAVPARMVHLELVAELFAGVQAFCTLGVLQGYWQCTLAAGAQELFIPTRVPQGVLIETAYFQGMMASVLDRPVALSTSMWWCARSCSRAWS